MELLQRARDAGNCPPSLMQESNLLKEDAFESLLLGTLTETGLVLKPDAPSSSQFSELVQKACAIASIPASSEEIKKQVMAQRRALLLAVLAATPPSSPCVSQILASGYLTAVKLWLDEVLSGSVGGVDYLLHLLTSITQLPVTKTIVKNSGMGKAVGMVTKHSICKGTPNESAINTRVDAIKEAWKASVKALKSLDNTSESRSSTGSKRPPEVASSPVSAKKTKTEPVKTQGSSFSSLMKKVSGPAKTNPAPTKETTVAAETESKKTSKKGTKRVKWADHFGDALSVFRQVETSEAPVTDSANAKAMEGSWSDRRKRDRLREKELLAKAKSKRAKLLDDDEDAGFGASMTAKVGWKIPVLLPPIPDVMLPSLESPELTSQAHRISVTPRANYQPDSVPPDAIPMTESEVAMDTSSAASIIVASIPFMAPPPPPQPPAPAPALPVAPKPSLDTSDLDPVLSPANTVVTAEYIQANGLPPILIGQDMSAVETVLNSADLLGSLVDPSGHFDGGRFLSLVQAISGKPPQSQSSGFSSGFGGGRQYGQSSNTSSYRNGAEDGNLHLSGYGPSTTQADIVALFSPYVQVDEVVMKGNFSFVNTSDPTNAQRAKEALAGSLLGGLPVRINPAQRKPRDNVSSYQPASAITGSFQASTYRAQPTSSSLASGPASQPVDTDTDVRDDKGNPATKNLFCAGYGPGTSEQQIRDIFGQYANVIGVVNKGSFTFVNTSDKQDAIRARAMLMGTNLNGGTLRINFAKETGRLGTSFDLTYGRNTGPNAKAPALGQVPAAPSYYGRGY